MKIDQSTPMASTRPPLAKKPRLQVQSTNSIKEAITRNVSTMRTDEAIASAANNPALQRALEVIRSGGIQARKRKTMAKGKSKVIAPKCMRILTTIPEDDMIIPPIKVFEIDIKGMANVGMLPEYPSKKGKHFDYEVIESSPF